MAHTGTHKRGHRALVAALLVASAMAGVIIDSSTAHAAAFTFSTGAPDGLMAMASRPASGTLIETEAADDFILSATTTLTQGTFTGLLPSADPLSDVQQVVVEIYRVFPQDSNVGRTSGPPAFSTPNVPTRVNSPSDVAFADADSSASQLSFTPSVVAPSFTAVNSVNTGINPVPNQTTGGDGAVTGEEVQFNVTFTPPLSLPPGHYFFVPQVKLGSPHVFYWLSAPKPAPGISPDLQAWIRNANLDPDWLRVGTDIVGGSPAPTFNGTFSLSDSLLTVVTGNHAGNINTPAGSAVDIENATITGNVRIFRATVVRICNTTIDGNLTVSRATGFVLVGDDGDDGASCSGNHVGRSVRLLRNTAGAELGATTTGGNVFITSNLGGTGEDVAPEVEANNISGSLKCKSNTPAPINGTHSNSVAGPSTGQCVGL
jgi:hypothetical protein